MASGVEANGYFTLKPNIPSAADPRARSMTTNGVLPANVRRESFLTGSTPAMTPRLEALRRDSTWSNAEKLPNTLWDYLMLELENFEIKGVDEYKKERLTNFLRIPETFEKVFA